MRCFSISDIHKWAASCKNGPYGIILIKMLIFIFWIYIIFRLICDILSRLAVKISFLWSWKHRYSVYATAPIVSSVTLWYLRNNMQNFTSVFFLYTSIICITQWPFGANLKFSILFRCIWMTSKNRKLFSSKHFDFLTVKIWRHFSITSQLHMQRALFVWPAQLSLLVEMIFQKL